MKNILTAGENRRIAKAMLDYSMLADGDRVLLAVSGGIDSLVLAWLLHNWLKKAPIDYELQAVYVDMHPAGESKAGAGKRAGIISRRLAALGLSCQVLPGELPARPNTQQSGDRADRAGTSGICFQCARNRRRLLFEHAREQGFKTIALGHHRDDIAETFFINLTCSGNISTMRPKQVLFSGRLALIRPLAYLVKEEIRGIGNRLGLEAVASDCPLSEQTRRQDIRVLLQNIYKQIPGSREHIFAALGNVRQNYLLIQESSTHQEEDHANQS